MRSSKKRGQRLMRCYDCRRTFNVTVYNLTRSSRPRCQSCGCTFLVPVEAGKGIGYINPAKGMTRRDQP